MITKTKTILGGEAIAGTMEKVAKAFGDVGEVTILHCCHCHCHYRCCHSHHRCCLCHCLIVVAVTNTIAIIAIAIAIIVVARSLIEMLFYAAFHPNMIRCLLIVKSPPFPTILCFLTLQVLEYVETGAEGAAKAIP